MKFWGVEVKPGETIKCKPGEGKLLHLSQAALGKTKDKRNVLIYVKFNDQKLVLGTLSVEKCAQITYDLVFEKEFELSHSSNNASVYFCGYRSDLPAEDFPGYDDISDKESDEVAEIAHNVNDKHTVTALGEKEKSNVVEESNAAAEAKARTGAPVLAEQKAADEDDEDDDSEDEDFDADMTEDQGDSDDDEYEDDESSEEDEDATPNKCAEKRKTELVSKTPVPWKKAKVVTPGGKNEIGGDGKKSVHFATPYPAKQAGKTPANSDKSKKQSPMYPVGFCPNGFPCKIESCGKAFNTDDALRAHLRVKHGIGEGA